MRIFLFLVLILLFGLNKKEKEKSFLYNEKGQLKADTTYNVAIEKINQFTKYEEDILNCLKNNIRYPEMAKDGRLQGLAIVKFKIENGNPGEIKMERFVGGGTDEIVVSGIKNCGEELNAQSISTYYIPVEFRLEEKDTTVIENNRLVVYGEKQPSITKSGPGLIGNPLPREEAEKNNYFDCSYYNYFSDTAYPVITEEDSIQLKRYSEKYHELANRYGYFSASLAYFVPFIRGVIDTTWAEKLQIEETYKFHSLDYSDLIGPITRDAVILGKVIDKRYPGKDTSKCLFFLVDYVIEVKQVVHSYFNLKKGDKVLVKGLTGYTGCGGTLLYGDSPHVKAYKVGDENLFLLDRHEYQRYFNMSWFTGRYDEEYCPQFFRMPLGNHDYHKGVIDRIDDLKLFFETEFKKLNHE